MNYSIIIPALEPDKHLIKLIEQIRMQTDQPIIIVDDGSGSEYQAIFQEISRFKGTIVIHQEANLGKGTALKLGFKKHLELYPYASGVVTADSDGQHQAGDIVKIAKELQPNYLIMGIRSFDYKEVPWKSYFGNTVTAKIFKLSTGKSISDTQTGLRGIANDLLASFIEVAGERFEYEMNVLLEVKNLGYHIKEISITTIYRDGNTHSHFRAVRDSLMIYQKFLRYIMVAVSSFCIDILVYDNLNF